MNVFDEDYGKDMQEAFLAWMTEVFADEVMTSSIEAVKQAHR